MKDKNNRLPARVQETDDDETTWLKKVLEDLMEVLADHNIPSNFY